MNQEQERLLEKAKRSLQAAKELNSKGFPEFASSRGYYAMFYVATAFLESYSDPKSFARLDCFW